jgi:proline racemase
MKATGLIHAVDAHAEGEATRVVVVGLLETGRASMAERRARRRSRSRSAIRCDPS